VQEMKIVGPVHKHMIGIRQVQLDEVCYSDEAS
jgi:hypothetical protein